MTAILVRILSLTMIFSTFACKKDTLQKPAPDVSEQGADANKVVKLEDATSAEEIRLLRDFDTLSCGKQWEFKLVGLSLSMIGREGCKEVSKEETVTLTSEQRSQIVEQLASLKLKPAAVAPCPAPSPETIISLVIAKKGYSYRSENCGEGGYVISDEDLDTTFKLFLRFHRNAPAP
ncbi:MAG: hypothetical protein WCI18_04790 [Pseudomonadota bacterium]